MPEGKWNFDGDVTDSFENMLERSIPQYREMRWLVYQLGVKYAQRDTTIADIGCSRGEAMAALVDSLNRSNRFIGLEISEPMLKAARDRFLHQIKDGYVEIRKYDLRAGLPKDISASVILSILTVQFVPIEYRLGLMKSVHGALLDGGALLLVEKVLGNTSGIDASMVDCYYDMKRRNGYTEDQIQRKRLSLEGVLVPVTAKWNEDLLIKSGFREVDCFWRWMNFAAWLALK